MSETDKLIQSAVKDPKDATLRGALADKLREVGEPELGDVIESDLGEALLEATRELSSTAKLPASLKLLWACHTLLPRLQATPEAAPVFADMPQPAATPDWPGLVPGRPGLVDYRPLPWSDNTRYDGHTVGDNPQLIVTPNWTCRSNLGR
jgi:hypothetical protein